MANERPILCYIQEGFAEPEVFAFCLVTLWVNVATLWNAGASDKSWEPNGRS